MQSSRIPKNWRFNSDNLLHLKTINKYNINLKFKNDFIEQYSNLEDLYNDIYEKNEDFHLLTVFKEYKKNNFEIIHYDKKLTMMDMICMDQNQIYMN